MRALIKTAKIVDRYFEETMLIIMLSSIAVIVFCQVVLRYVFSFVPAFMDELSIWLFIWTIWIGVAYGFKHQIHISITVLSNRFPKALRLIIAIGIDIIVLAFFLYMCWWGYVQASSATIVMQKSTVIINPFTGNQFSMSVLYAAVPLGSLLSCYRVVRSLYSRLTASLPISTYSNNK